MIISIIETLGSAWQLVQSWWSGRTSVNPARTSRRSSSESFRVAEEHLECKRNRKVLQVWEAMILECNGSWSKMRRRISSGKLRNSSGKSRNLELCLVKYIRLIRVSSLASCWNRDILQKCGSATSLVLERGQ